MQLLLHILFYVCGFSVIFFLITLLYGIHLSAREAKDKRLGVIIMTALKAEHESEKKE